ncbi:MAG: helix-turn-helix domain-containing protein [Desulfovibrionaceae bacterium]
MTEEQRDFLTVNEVAFHLNVDPETVRRWIGRGALVASKPGRVWRIEREEYERFKAAIRVVPVGEEEGEA